MTEQTDIESIEPETIKTLTDLIAIPKESALDIFTKPNGLDPYIEIVKSKAANVVADISTEKGRKSIKALARQVASSKTYLDNVDKEVVAELKRKPALIDAERKRAWDILQALQDEVRKPLTEWETAETARVEAINKRIEDLFKPWIWVLLPETVETLKNLLDEINKHTIDDWYGEFKSNAETEKKKAIEWLESQISVQKFQDKQQAELNRLRQESAEREQREHDEKIAREAEEKGRRETEEKAKREAQNAQQREISARVEAETKARQAQADLERKEREPKAELERIEGKRIAEKQRMEREQAEQEAEQQRLEDLRQAELKRRQEDMEHRATVRQEALEGFVTAGFSKQDARKIISTINMGSIPHVTINY